MTNFEKFSNHFVRAYESRLKDLMDAPIPTDDHMAMHLAAVKQAATEVGKAWMVRPKTVAAEITKQVIDTFRAVTAYYGISTSELLKTPGSNHTMHPAVHARQVLAWLLRHTHAMSYSQIAAALGRGSHNIALYSVNQVDLDPELRSIAGKIKKSLETERMNHGRNS